MESSDYPHSIVKEVQTRKQKKQQDKLKKIEQEIFDIYYQHYKKIRFKYYGWINLLDESEKKHISSVVECGVQKEFNETILPKIKKQKLLFSGIPAVGIGAGSVVAGIISKTQEIVPDEFSACLIYSGASAIFLGATLGAFKTENTVTLKNEVYQKYLTQKMQKSMLDRCEIRYQQDLIHGNIKRNSLKNKKNFNKDYGNVNEK